MSGRPAPAPAPRPPASPSPDRYLRQHGPIEPPRVDATAFRPAWRRRSRLDKLLTDGTITPMQWQIAVEYRRTHETAFGSILRSRSLDGTGAQPGRTGRRAALDPSEAQLAAVEKLQLVRSKLGAAAVQLIELVVIEDLFGRSAPRVFVAIRRRQKPRARLSLQALAQMCDARLADPGFARDQHDLAIPGLGDLTEGISLLRSGSTASRATGAELWMPYYIALLAGACEIAEQIEEGLTLLDDALQIVKRTGERWFAAELYRRKGQLLQRQGQSEAAEELYHKALSIAEEQGAKLWELRAATSLARLRLDQGRQTEARDLRAPVYAWFTEGFATPDLKEAKALLDEL
jgi:tetratricopeptide (TPR) repeat protein